MENGVRNNRSNTSLIVVIVILVAVLCTLLGLILGGKFKDKENTTNPPVEDKDNNVEEQIPTLTKNEVEELTRSVADTASKNHLFELLIDNPKSDEFKLFIAYNNVKDTSKQKTNCEKLFSNNKEAIKTDIADSEGYRLKLDNGVYGYCIDETTLYNYDEINNEYKKLFGTDVSKISTSNIFDFLYYDNQTSNYIVLECGGCGGAYPSYKYTLETYNQEGKKLNVNINYTIIKPENSIETTGQLKLIFEYENNRFIFKDAEKVS